MAKTQEQKDADKAAKAAVATVATPAQIEDTPKKGENKNVTEFKAIIEAYKIEKPESYERSEEEYKRIIAKLEANPTMHFNDIGFTSYDNNKVLG